MFGVDFEAYRAAVQSALSHKPLYPVEMDATTLRLANPYLYPPSALLVLWPLGLLPATVAVIAWFAMSVLTVVVSVRLVLARMGRSLTAASSWRLITWVLLTWGVWYGLVLGQVGPLLLFLCAADLLRSNESRWSGALVGVAAAIKITPALFLVWLWLIGRRRAAATGVAVWAALTCMAWILLPADSVRFWLRGTVVRPPEVITPAATNNQAVAAWIYRLTGETGIFLALVAGGLVVGLGLLAAQRLSRLGAPVSAIAVVGVVTASASPIGWTHQWTWCPILVIALWYELGARTSRLVVLGLGIVLTVPLVAVLPWFLTPNGPLLDRVASGAYVIATALVLVVTLGPQLMSTAGGMVLALRRAT